MHSSRATHLHRVDKIRLGERNVLPLCSVCLSLWVQSNGQMRLLQCPIRGQVHRLTILVQNLKANALDHATRRNGVLKALIDDVAVERQLRCTQDHGLVVA